MSKISWNGGKTQFLGRNGDLLYTAFKFERVRFQKNHQKDWPVSLRDVIRVYPVTTRERKRRCFIEIPTKWAGLFMKALDSEATPK